MFKTPVAFFGFNRPDTTRAVFEEIRRQRPDRLFLVADGPRTHVPTDAARCEAVRAIMQAVDWPCEVRTNFSEVNLGCGKRMSSGIDWVFSQVEEAILLEDDCLPCPDFFRFCAAMLERFRDVPRIMHIGGANFQGGRQRGNGSYYFSTCVHIWGWATWRRAWKFYDVEMRSWPRAREEGWIKTLPLTPLEQALQASSFEQIFLKKIDTWDYQWTYACLRQNGLAVIPNVNLVTNIGAGPEATHTRGEVGSLALPTGILSELREPEKVAPDRVADYFTFLDHWGGRQMLADQSPWRRMRRFLSRIKRAVKWPERKLP